MPVLQVGDARFNYLQQGPSSGPTSSGVEDLVMVHGLATNLAFWYLPYASVFAQRFRVTVFDLRGHGRSEVTPSGYTPQAQAADLEGVLDALGIERAHFVAHSYGGVITLGLARHAPQRVRSLVLADTQVSATRHASAGTWPHSRLIQTLLDRHGLDLDANSPHFGFHLLTRVSQLLLRHGELPEDVAELVGPTLGKRQRRTAKRWLALAEHAHDELIADDGLTSAVLRSLRFPLLAMYGDRSKAGATNQLLREAWPHAEFVTVPDAGHFFPTSRSGDVIAACNGFWDTLCPPASKEAV